jgi:hypothetical protein
VTRVRSATVALVRANSSSSAAREAMAAACETVVALNGTYTLPSATITSGSAIA